jgi:hypothetical protein
LTSSGGPFILYDTFSTGRDACNHRDVSDCKRGKGGDNRSTSNGSTTILFFSLLSTSLEHPIDRKEITVMVRSKFGALIPVLIAAVLAAALPLGAVTITNDFEDPGDLNGYIVDGWGFRDVTSCQWGPQTQTTPGGSFAVGVPEVCQAGYPNGNPSQLWEGTLTTPKIALDNFPSLYIGFNYWADFEGVTDTFDGVILEITNLTQNIDYVQIDPDAMNELCPTYDAIIGTTNPRLTGLWAYCYDTLAPTFNSLGYPFLVLQSIRPGEPVPERPRPQPNMPTDFEWRSLVSVDLIAAGYAAQGDTVRIRWTFASDQLANGQGYFFDDLFISSDAPADQQPPTIDVTSPEMWANIPTPDQPITVSADVSEACGGSGVNADSVFLVWELAGTPQDDIAMTNVGGDTFEGMLPGQPFDTDIRYRIRATDNEGNTGSSPWRHLEVTDAITLLWDEGVPASVFPDLEAGDGFAVRYTAPADKHYLIHKIMYYFAREDGQFHVVVNADNGGIPGAELFRDNDVTNGAVANTFYEYEFSPVDSVVISAGQSFHVGMRLATSDTLFDPQMLTDGNVDFSGDSWAFIASQGGWGEVDAETMIRCKVKELDATGVGDHGGVGSALPRAYALGQNFPNPFNPSTTIRFAIPAGEGEAGVHTTLSVFNLRGQLVRTLVDEEKAPGEYSVQWDGRNDKGEPTGSGVFLYRLQSGDYSATRKMIIVK